MAKITRGRNLKDFNSQQASADVGKLRIIGGKFRGRQIEYSGDPVTRPMKDITREACFNLVGAYVDGKAAFDLFAGTGAIGLEALSRGATRQYLSNDISQLYGSSNRMFRLWSWNRKQKSSLQTRFFGSDSSSTILIPGRRNHGWFSAVRPTRFSRTTTTIC